MSNIKGRDETIHLTPDGFGNAFANGDPTKGTTPSGNSSPIITAPSSGKSETPTDAILDGFLIEWALRVNYEGRMSVPWRLDSYGGDGALSQVQIGDLARRFKINSSDLSTMSRSIGIALDPDKEPNLVPVQRSRAAAMGNKAVACSLVEIGSAYDKVVAAAERLEALAVDVAFDSEAASHFRQIQDELWRCVSVLAPLEDALASLESKRDLVLVLEPTDKRRIVDHRRRGLLNAVFAAWRDAGRKLTYTTDPITSERRGPLIDFANAVVGCVTEPPSSLSAEMIVRELRAYLRPKGGELQTDSNVGSR